MQVGTIGDAYMIAGGIVGDMGDTCFSAILEHSCHDFCCQEPKLERMSILQKLFPLLQDKSANTGWHDWGRVHDRGGHRRRQGCPRHRGQSPLPSSVRLSACLITRLSLCLSLSRSLARLLSLSFSFSLSISANMAFARGCPVGTD